MEKKTWQISENKNNIWRGKKVYIPSKYAVAETNSARERTGNQSHRWGCDWMEPKMGGAGPKT